MCIGLVDADLLDNGTRHPSPAMPKNAGFFYDDIIRWGFILNPKEDITRFDRIYLSRVLSFITLTPSIIKPRALKILKNCMLWNRFLCRRNQCYKKRKEDMTSLEKDEFLNGILNKGGRHR